MEGDFEKLDMEITAESDVSADVSIPENVASPKLNGLKRVGAIKTATFSAVLLAIFCSKEDVAFAQQSGGRDFDSGVVQMERLPQFRVDTASDYALGVDRIYSFLDIALPEADTSAQKISVYESALRKYSIIEQKSGISEDQRRRIAQSKSYIEAKIRALLSIDKSDRYDYTWFDDANDLDLLKFIERFPGLTDGMISDVRNMFMASGNDRGSLDLRVKFYSNLVERLRVIIVEDCARMEDSLSLSLQFESDEKSRESLIRQYVELQEYKTGLRHFMNVFGYYRDWMLTAQEAYDRYIPDRDTIEKTIQRRISSGEIRVPKDAPYIVFVNRDVDGQYAVVYKYDRTNKSLILKTYNLVSTGSATRWLDERGADLSTPAMVFHIGHVFSAKALKKRGVPYGASYGSHYVDQDKEPYKIFGLIYKMGTDQEREWIYYMHGTDEENLLGSTQSHGCIRVPRIFNLAMMKVFLRHYYQRYERSRSPKDEQQIRDFENIDFTGYGDSPLRIPVVVANVRSGKKR